MATQRYISTSFWDDEWVSTLDPSEKLLYLYFMTNPLTNIAGIYETTMRRICFDTGFNEETTDRMIKRFNNDHKLYFLHNFVIIPSWPKHQKWEDKHTIRKGIDSILSKVPKMVWYDIVRYAIPYAYPIDSLLIAYGYDPSYLNLNLDSNLNSDTDTNIMQIPSSLSSSNSQPFENWTGEKPKTTKSIFTEITEYWNQQVPKQATPFTAMNMSLSGDIITLLEQTEIEVIKTAIDHYGQAYEHNKYRVSGFTNFMTIKNVESWFPESSVENRKGKEENVKVDNEEEAKAMAKEIFG